MPAGANAQSRPPFGVAGFGHLWPRIILAMTGQSQTDRLESWKAIARYIGRSVRTARRWEAEEGMPVHRQMHKAQGTVYAIRDELDRWRDGRAVPTRGMVESLAPARRKVGSVVVLPFIYLGHDPTRAYIADGCTEEIIHGLSQVRSLRVISWTSSMTLKNSTKSAGAIGRELSVRRLVEGTVRHEGDRLKVSARLIDTDSDDQMWSQTYGGRLSDLFDIQAQIARSVADVLDLGRAEVWADGHVGTIRDDIVAWSYVTQARQVSLGWRKPSIENAVGLLRDGLTVVGDHAELYAALGRTYIYYREAGVDLSENPVREAEACADAVARLDPTLAAGHQLQGWIHYSKNEIVDAVRALERALIRDRNDPDSLRLMVNCLLVSGCADEARSHIDQLMAIDPLTPLTRCLPGYADLLEGRFHSAVAPYREMFDMDPANTLARLFLVYVLAVADQRDEAFELATSLSPRDATSAPGRIIALFAHALAGKSFCEAPIQQVEALAQGTDLLPRFTAIGYALLGDANESARWLRVAVERGFVNYPYLAEHEPFVGSLKGDSSLDGVLADARIGWRAFREQHRSPVAVR